VDETLLSEWVRIDFVSFCTTIVVNLTKKIVRVSLVGNLTEKLSFYPKISLESLEIEFRVFQHSHESDNETGRIGEVDLEDVQVPAVEVENLTSQFFVIELIVPIAKRCRWFCISSAGNTNEVSDTNIDIFILLDEFL
jgi:hypothetical protein